MKIKITHKYSIKYIFELITRSENSLKKDVKTLLGGRIYNNNLKNIIFGRF